MPINYARRLVGHKRTVVADRHLGYTLAFVAGATNAGGFLAVRQYTSHMTGIVSSMADNVALGAYDLVLGGAGALFAFVAGATCSSIMVIYARRRSMNSVFALPLLLEALLLLCFGLLGARLTEVHGLFVPVTVMLLCFIMGLQNALITKLSKTEIRTTHVTGIVTDIGIELGRLASSRSDVPGNLIVAATSWSRLRILSLMVMSFLAGGIAGALGFKYVGYSATLPLALVVALLASVPAIDDIRILVRRL